MCVGVWQWLTWQKLSRRAAHIVEILAAAHEALQQQRPVDLHSEFEPPASMEWAD